MLLLFLVSRFSKIDHLDLRGFLSVQRVLCLIDLPSVLGLLSF